MYCEVRFDKTTDDMELVVRNGFKEDSPIIPMEQKDQIALKAGVYSYDLHGSHICDVHKIFVIRTEECGKNKTIQLPIIPYRGEEAEFKGKLFLFSDEIEEKLYSIDNLNEMDMDIFLTPAFDEKKSKIQFTKNDERIQYLKEILKNVSYSYLECDEYEFPVVIFALGHNLDRTTNEILSELKTSDKINVFYHAQLHGLEAAAGEAALSIVNYFASEKGWFLLEKMNVVLIPCVNCKGNSELTRECDGIDLNRDFIKADSKVTQEIQHIFYSFLPEVVIDGHTWTRCNSFKGEDFRKSLFDARISAANTRNMTGKIRNLNENMAICAQNACLGKGLRAGYYGASIKYNTAKSYYSLSQCCSILVESEGSRSAKFHYKRNVWTHYVAVTSILKYVFENAGNIKDAVVKARKKRNRNYVSKEKSFKTRYYVSDIDEYDFYGDLINKNTPIYFRKYGKPKEKVKIPKAFIIKTEDVTRQWLEKLKFTLHLDFKEKHIRNEILATVWGSSDEEMLLKGTKVILIPVCSNNPYVLIEIFREHAKDFLSTGGKIYEI